MNYTIKFFTILAFIILPVINDSKSDTIKYNDEKSLILKNFDKQIECWKDGDIDCYMTCYVVSEDVKAVTSQGIINGHKELTTVFKQYWNAENMGVLEFFDIKLEKLSDEYYYSNGKFKVTMPDKKIHEGYFSSIMKKVGNEWLIYKDHS